MAQQFTTLIFDWDGTLMDSIGLIACLICEIGDEFAMPVGMDEARGVIGLGLPEATRQLFPKANEQQHEQIQDRYRHLCYRASTQPSLFPEVQACLQEWNNDYHLAVATGKSRRGLNDALQASGIEQLFSVTRCADETFSKPHPLMIEQILDFLGVPPEQALLIGDSSYDMELASNAGVAACALTTGAHPRETLLQYNPVACLNDLYELRRWLKTGHFR